MRDLDQDVPDQRRAADRQNDEERDLMNLRSRSDGVAKNEMEEDAGERQSGEPGLLGPAKDSGRWQGRR
jgi:hypothetical protein